MNLNRCLFWGRYLCLAACLSGCAFSHGYSTEAHRQLQKLEALQMQFLRDGTEMPLDPQALQHDHQRILRQFDQAIALAHSLDDAPRTDTFLTLQTEYQRLHARFSQQQRAFTPAQFTIFGQQIHLMYQLAADGECARSGADCASGGV
ncbi:hypothetical protein [Pseudocitrobacter cyperus]|uniref:Lipoprotein n=1 Tax=Pseudocitrobacter cyperus TaxID=3112843 RepID=A0ABV0HNV1_9ENTR